MKILVKSIYFLLIACILYFLVNYLSVPPKASKNFKTKHYISKTDENNHIIVQDLAQNLIFTNMQKGCKPINKKDTNALEIAKLFCKNLELYNYFDWRVPTLMEIQNFSKGMHDENLVPFFTYPQCELISGIKKDGTLGAINTHNKFFKFKKVPMAFPVAVKCVRNNDI